MARITDIVHAFTDQQFKQLPQGQKGVLSGCTLAVKDIFDVRGYKTGCGSPEKMAQALPAKETSSMVQKLLDAGAEFVGKTKTEELAFSLNGDNAHYSRPINFCAPDRLTGGSSSGSAAAVCGGLVDIATASDTAGSVRLPASYCGLIGLRTTHGRLDLSHMMPLARSLDTFGWFARNAEIYEKVGSVLLGQDTVPYIPKRVLIADDCLTLLMNVETVRALDAAVNYLVDYTVCEDVDVVQGAFDHWCETLKIIQAYEAWQEHGNWIKEVQPNLGPGVKERFAFGETIAPALYQDALKKRVDISHRLENFIGHDGLLVLPTVPSVAPLINEDFEALGAFRDRALRLLCLSSLSGLPQITLPMAHLNGMPLGLSLMGPRGADKQLMRVGLEILDCFKSNEKTH